jgi:hypothetical protein
MQFVHGRLLLSLVEHPARMECGQETAAAEFAPSYRRASILQATLAALGLVSSIAAWLSGASFLWVVAGALPLAVKLLARWGMLHAVRRALSALALFLFRVTGEDADGERHEGHYSLPKRSLTGRALH